MSNGLTPPSFYGINPYMLKPILADLHVHTVLSPCAETEMIPPLIVERAQRLGLGMIAITDHNACFNVEAVMKAAAERGLHVFAGMELQTLEEVHLLCLFDTLAQCLSWQEEVFGRLPPLFNQEEFFGAQFVVDATGEWIRTEERLLATSAGIPLEEAVSKVHRLGGLAVPAHVDRPSFSILSNLGFLPESLEADALEVTHRFLPLEGFSKWPEMKRYSLIMDGDAHRLSEMRNRTLFQIQGPAMEEISLAFRGEGGRRVIVEWEENPYY
jgi:PHP family Zn ribbon phosphoesterase